MDKSPQGRPAESRRLIALDQALLSGGALNAPQTQIKLLKYTIFMFIGEYQHSLDDKGRLAIPAKFRARLAKGAVVTRGLDQSLFLYPLDEWRKLADRLAKLPLSQANTRAFSRLMLAGAMDVRVDSQGRIMLPDYLRKYAKMGKKIVLAGLYNRIELWDNEAWNHYKNATEKKSSDIAEQLGDLGV